MSNKKPWFPMYAADFLTDTQAMSHQAVGVYTRLLLYQWINGAVPRPPSQLSRIAGCDISELDELWPELEPKFVGDHITIHNPRLEQVRTQQDRYVEQKRRAGRASGAARRQKGNGTKDIEHPFDSVGNETRTKTNQSKSKSKTKGTKRGQQLPEEWRPASNLLDWAAKNFPRVNTIRETAKFKDYWKSKGEVRKDWNATWRNWIRKADEFIPKTRASTFGLKDADRVCIREHKTRREGEPDADFIDRMRMIEDGFT